jgi:uncharacterized membrane protein SpoIIM required for sporulation
MWEFWPVLLMIAFVGTTLGLAISAMAPSEGVAVAMIPIAVIPQIILSGAIVTLTGTTRLAGELFVTTYWGKRGLDAYVQGEAGKFAREEAKPKLIDSDSIWLPATIMGIHALVFCVFAIAALASNGSLRGAIGKLGGMASGLLPSRPPR